MRKEVFTNNGIAWERITRSKAERAYREGHKIALCPVNVSANSVTGNPVPVTNGCGRTFQALVNEFEYYNCDRERGRYAKFFIEN